MEALLAKLANHDWIVIIAVIICIFGWIKPFIQKNLEYLSEISVQIPEIKIGMREMQKIIDRIDKNTIADREMMQMLNKDIQQARLDIELLKTKLKEQ